MAEVILDGVTKRFGDVTALDNVSLTIADGAFTSVFGPPGSGKSVLLRVLLGLDPIDAGRIIINGQDVTNAAPDARGLSMVFQNLALFPHLTARQNIAFPMHRRNAPEAEIDTRLSRLAGLLNIGHILHKRPAALSGGERQRVAIGRALIRDASAYMMDEPIAALDARLRDVMRVELKRLQTEQGQTFIYVTHDCDEAMSVADIMVILDHGRVAWTASGGITISTRSLAKLPRTPGTGTSSWQSGQRPCFWPIQATHGFGVLSRMWNTLAVLAS
jgi:multiple sugar transport system ATP-binding protein